MTDASIRTEAILLRSVDFREADRMLTLLTPNQGRVSAVARAARSSRRRFAGALEPFSVVEMTLSAGRQGLYRLQEAQVIEAFPTLLGDFSRMEQAGRCLDVARSFAVENASDPELFNETRQLLAAMDLRPTTRLALVRLCFQMRVLDLAGLGPELRHCGMCGRRPSESQPAMFDPSLGHLICRSCGRASIVLSADARSAWQMAARRGVIAEPQLQLTEAALAQLADALHALLRLHIKS